MTTFVIESNKKVASAPVRLVRTASENGIVVADSDMSAVWILTPGMTVFKPLVQAGWPSKLAPLPGVVARPNCSRVYLPSIAAGVVCMKLGVKEVEDSGVPFDKCDWGMYLVGLNEDGTVRWNGRYPIHKGNAQVVKDPNDATTVRLIASTGIAWKIRISDGAIVQQSHVVMGESGEKNKARSNELLIQTAFVGYTGHPSGMARIGIDTKSVSWASKPPFSDMGDDMTYADIISAWSQPRGLWVVAVHQGSLRYNFVGPKARVAKFSMSNPGNGGEAAKESRFAPSLFRLVGNKKAVGVAFAKSGAVYVQVLSDQGSRKQIGAGAWPEASAYGDKTLVRYFRGGDLYEAVVTQG